MRKKIPNPLRFGGLEIKIVKPITFTPYSGDLGMYIMPFSEIHLAAGLEPNLEENVLCHEIVEMINCCFDLNLPHETISCLGNAWFELLKNNDIYFFDPSTKIKEEED